MVPSSSHAIQQRRNEAPSGPHPSLAALRLNYSLWIPFGFLRMSLTLFILDGDTVWPKRPSN